MPSILFLRFENVLQYTKLFLTSWLACFISISSKRETETKEEGDERDREGGRKKRDYTQVQFHIAQVEARSL